MGITFTFIAQKDESAMGKQKMHYIANRNTALCKHLHKQHANTKLAKNLR